LSQISPKYVVSQILVQKKDFFVCERSKKSYFHQIVVWDLESTMVILWTIAARAPFNDQLARKGDQLAGKLTNWPEVLVPGMV